MSELKEFEEHDKFPEQYEINHKLKSPLNCLWYNKRNVFPDNYPAKMPEDFARDMILWYSKPGNLVWDCFNGSGTVVRKALELGRKAIGTDVNPKAIDLSKRHDPEHQSCYGLGDVRTVKLETKADLVFTSPPFGVSIGGDKNNYSNEKADLSNTDSIDSFLKLIRPAFDNIFDNLKPNGLFIFDARDRTKDGKYYDLSVIFRNMAIEVGFKVHCKYFYFDMPWSLYTYKNKENDQIMPDVSTTDAYVMFKPENQRLFQ